MLCDVFDIFSVEYNHFTVMHRFIELSSDILSICGESIYVNQQMHSKYIKKNYICLCIYMKPVTCFSDKSPSLGVR